MPNWTYNRIKCKKELGDKLLTINEDNYSLDFNKLIPMPEDLKLDAGTIENKSISCYYLSLSDEDKLKLMKFLKNKEVFFIIIIGINIKVILKTLKIILIS